MTQPRPRLTDTPRHHGPASNLGRSLVGCALTVIACNQPAAAPVTATETSFPILVSARAEGRQPVAAVGIRADGRLLGNTDASGHARLLLNGEEGERVALSVHCPADFASPERPIVVGLRHLNKGSAPPRFEVECVPLMHSVLVAVAAENGPRLPILHLKKKVGETDEFGTAHVLLRAANAERLTLTLDTSKSPNLRPQNPSLTFVASTADELVLLEQKLAVQSAPQRVRAKAVGPRPL